ncbi:conserved exported hypothetical protein [Candidatus Methylobacter favarea]|uniref:Uncharacterized protein n=1 Tax=Candidatus Methylobacter favarea TaxID=2707345 RepID=A0A8S0X0C2_9GAMM|nr:hypothetical protein [Candidatus Methylobacter favarea]CAA9890558.1 conserved exported hypothetical protein [Candidatus Methylobacter favarea]
MKIITMMKLAAVIAMVVFNDAAVAYSPEETEQECKKPRFREFDLPEYKAPENIEVKPESEFSFMVSPWADPTTIRLTAKKKKLDYTVESNSSFHRIKSKLPAGLNGQYVRIEVSVKAVLGCDEQGGWLVKVAK